MKRAKSLFNQIIDYENIRLAWLKARKAKTSKPAVRNFYKDVNSNLLKVQQNIKSKPPVLSPYIQFKIFDPKERVISVVPFIDRVMHHAVMNVLEPVFERQFIYHTYACRKNKGSHKAVAYAFSKARKNRYFLKLDVRKYFDSIDHSVLKAMLEKIIKDKECLNLLFSIIDSYGADEKSLPIGNLTSQFFANFYLSVLDHYVLEHLKPDGYVRYMDDIVLFGNSTAELKECFLKIRLFCREKLFLELKPRITGETKNGVSFLGYLITCRTVKLTRKTRRRKKQKIKILNSKIKNGTITEEEYAARIKCIFVTAFA